MNRLRRSSEDHAIAPEAALKAAEKVWQEARRKGVAAAIAGGLAMQIYGFTRATRDVDMVASETLDLEAGKKIDFGGEIYRLEVEGKEIEVDWIVRADDKKPVYDAALENAEMTEYGIPIISPDWMVLLKYLAGRGKDEMDLMWLLREPGLVDRNRVLEIIEGLMGPAAFWAKQDMRSVFLEADFLDEKDRS